MRLEMLNLVGDLDVERCDIGAVGFLLGTGGIEFFTAVRGPLLKSNEGAAIKPRVRYLCQLVSRPDIATGGRQKLFDLSTYWSCQKRNGRIDDRAVGLIGHDWGGYCRDHKRRHNTGNTQRGNPEQSRVLRNRGPREPWRCRLVRRPTALVADRSRSALVELIGHELLSRRCKKRSLPHRPVPIRNLVWCSANLLKQIWFKFYLACLCKNLRQGLRTVLTARGQMIVTIFERSGSPSPHVRS